jgi:uncharacterized protein (TIGR02246 family)
MIVLAVVVAAVSVHGQQVAQDKKIEDAARDALAAYGNAWNAGDPTALTDLYTVYGDYTGFGSVMSRGRDEILSRYTALLNGAYRGTQLSIAMSSLRLVGTDVALIDGTLELTGAGSNAAVKGMFVAIMTREQGEWKFTAFWSKRLDPLDGDS